jgi:hypothetical protein
MIISIIFLISCFQLVSIAQNDVKYSSGIINLGSRLEIFVDHFLIDTLINSRLKLHHPVDEGNVLNFNEPWEGPFSGYVTVIDNNFKYQLKNDQRIFLT